MKRIADWFFTDGWLVMIPIYFVWGYYCARKGWSYAYAIGPILLLALTMLAFKVL